MPPTFRARRREALKLSNSTDSFGAKIHQSCPPNPAPLERDLSAADFSPQGGCGIRKAAKPLTAAQTPRTAANNLDPFFAAVTVAALRFPRPLGVPIVPLPRNWLASSAAGGASPISMRVAKNTSQPASVRAQASARSRLSPPQNDGSANVLKFYFPNGQIG